MDLNTLMSLMGAAESARAKAEESAKEIVRATRRAATHAELARAAAETFEKAKAELEGVLAASPKAQPAKR